MAILLALLLVGACSRDIVPSWLTEEGFAKYFGDMSLFTSKAKLFRDARGYGFVLTKDVSAGEEILKVHTSLIISPYEYFEWSPKLHNLNPACRLMARVIYERLVRSPNSLKSAYFHALSPEAPSIPLFWTDQDFQLFAEVALHDISRSYFFILFNDLKRGLVQALRTIDNLPPKALEDDTLKWAFYQVNSRVFDIKEADAYYWLYNIDPSARVNLEDTTKVFVPIIDFCNHLPRPFKYQVKAQSYAVQYPKANDDYFILQADRKQKAGQEFVWSYGIKSNLHLLEAYGFVLEHNLNDHYYFRIKGANYCFEEKEGKECAYVIGRQNINSNFFRHLHQDYFNKQAPLLNFDTLSKDFPTFDAKTQEIILEVLRKYRKTLVSQLNNKIGLREIRRLSKSQGMNITEAQIYTLARETRETVHTHLMFIDVLYMGLVWWL